MTEPPAAPRLLIGGVPFTHELHAQLLRCGCWLLHCVNCHGTVRHIVTEEPPPCTFPFEKAFTQNIYPTCNYTPNDPRQQVVLG